jgi:hypothetical protein
LKSVSHFHQLHLELILIFNALRNRHFWKLDWNRLLFHIPWNLLLYLPSQV